MENRYQSRLRRNQANIVKEIAVKVQEVVLKVAQETIQEIVQEMKTTDHLISQVIKGSTKARPAKTWPLNSYNCKESQNIVALLFVYNKDDGKKKQKFHSPYLKLIRKFYSPKPVEQGYYNHVVIQEQVQLTYGQYLIEKIESKQFVLAL